MSSTFGKILSVTTFGESHCKAVGAVVDGFPSQISVKEEDIQVQLNRRRPGQNVYSTPRTEADKVSILSGVENGVTLGTPIALMVLNKDQRPNDYNAMAPIPRPSHADFTYLQKYGIKSSSGGGRSSARETIGRVAAGALAESMLKQFFGTEIVAWVSSIGKIDCSGIDHNTVNRQLVDSSPVRCPDPSTSEEMEKELISAKEDGDSLGGIISCVCRNVPAGWGEPVFEKLDAVLAQAMLSVPAIKGFEIGSGFGGSRMRGSEHNDPFCMKEGKIGTVTNNSGGVQGGISNGEPLFFRVAFKPVATISKAQRTIDFQGKEIAFEAQGRHDPCVVHRAVPVIEAMASLVLADMALVQSTRFIKNR
ncbi:chorismate synthase [Chitinispirillales bacterium ANBcel5]|uniref:chorismate synthase n=1 Tax=Cellulosispirillum alkaliphilum TaxID=3039283 RepID=UPI002A526305|nr:chorismate synthase [Chitinispirillales bacterium ANBcel5]